MRQVGPPAVFQIHHEERHVAGDIDPTKGVIELNAVENDHGVVQQDYVPQMQISVAFAHETVALASYESGATGGKRALAPGFEFPGVGLPDRVIDGIEQVLKILLHGLIDSLWCPKAARRVCRRNAGMKRAHLMGQGVDVRHLKLAGIDEMAQ